MKKIKVFLDDIRPPPAGWILVHWPNEAIKLLQEFDVEEISLDHDLGDDQRGTGYDVILWIEEKVALDGFVPPKIVVHSANVSARLKMEQGIKNIIKLSKHYE
ncbi:cyclic-phosphate processing receiver domain-containing protein [Pseudomonas syringae]|uniref:cyclic-phosphate processing receiver domain-containing protein n=1 Tax=Pseudomonas syringae TaxID=317 RepID=UPI001F3DA05A|nr:cyclic-phosphate processing receiver domain-containing protein [Pseudomonas syringae]